MRRGRLAAFFAFVVLIAAVACAKSDSSAAKSVDSTVASPSAGGTAIAGGTAMAGGAASATASPTTTSRAAAASGAVLADTARGIVSVVGNEPVSSVLLSFGADAAPLALVGDPSTRQLRAMAGIEVVVSGRRTIEIDRMASPRGAAVFRVEHFVVRAVDGIAAEDGELVSTSAGFVLRRADGKELKITSVPPALRSRVGARVYLAGPLDRAVVAYGVIVP